MTRKCQSPREMQSSVSYFCLNRAFRGAREYLRWQLQRARLLCREKWNHLVNLPCASLRKQWEASCLSRPRPRNQTCTSLALTSLLIKPHVTHVPASLFCVHMGTGITAGRMEGGGWQSRHRAGARTGPWGGEPNCIPGWGRQGWAEDRVAGQSLRGVHRLGLSLKREGHHTLLQAPSAPWVHQTPAPGVPTAARPRPSRVAIMLPGGRGAEPHPSLPSTPDTKKADAEASSRVL